MTFIPRIANRLAARLVRTSCAPALLALLSAAPAHAFEAWATPGSSGIVDEGSTNLIAFSLGSAAFRSGQVGTVTLRYPVTDVFPDTANPSPKWFGLGFIDNGSEARVTARLVQQSRSTGTITYVSPSFDSDALTASGSYQFGWTHNCAMALDFFENAYWVEVTLRRTSTAGNASVQQVRLDNYTCTGFADTEGANLR